MNRADDFAAVDPLEAGDAQAGLSELALDDDQLAADGVGSRRQIDAALAYRDAYPDEVRARIELHRSETAAAEAR